MFGLGATELIIILVIVLVIFGAGKLPKVMKDLGKGARSFKEALNETDPPPEQPSPAAEGDVKKKNA